VQTLQIITLGCSKNRVDSEHVAGQLRSVYDIVPEGETCAVDVLMLNTCGFIGDAKEESVQAVLEAVRLKAEGQVKRIVVFGCLSQRYSSELPELIPEVDAWFGARDFSKMVNYLGASFDAGTFQKERVLDTPSHYAFLKISEGCDRRCSYCAIPHIRGAHKSVPEELLVQEASTLAAKGVKELIVIAQDTTFYGLDLYGKRTLGHLLERLSAIDGIEWIRIHYSYPSDFPDDVLDQMASNPKICPYMDIPLQHVADKVLSNMHRHVTSAQTKALVRRMRERVPGIVLRTTMMVGHPGEGTREYEQLLSFIRSARFERLGAFKYSEEEGTYGAEHFNDTVRTATKQKRLDRLMEEQSRISLAFNQSRVGTIERVIVDDFKNGVFVCRSRYESPEVDGEILVGMETAHTVGLEPNSLIGEFVDVEIVGADEYDLIARFTEI